LAGLGGALMYRGATGHCSAYQAMGVDTAQADGQDEIASKGVHIEQAFTINRSAEDLYNYWRNFENLPLIMSYLESVHVRDDGQSHWVAKAPSILGGRVEWDAQVTRDEPNALIAWRSLPGSQIDTAGEIRFSRAPGDRGTEVHVYMDYVPPAGMVGDWIAWVFGSSPKSLIREDLRNFKRIMEVGEVLKLRGQPQGTCLGHGGSRNSEST